MNPYADLADEFYSNMNLNTEMALPTNRETILGFLERIQKSYPSMRNFYTRDNGDFVLEEDKDQPEQRWLSLEPRRINSGFVNPPDMDQSFDQHQLVLQQAPYMLSVSPLDCEALDYMVGFDFSYRGNHDALVAEALRPVEALESLMDIENSQVLNFEPSLTLGLEDSCRRQARLMVETRTNAYQVRRGDFPEEMISVFFTVRQYGSLEHDKSFEQTLVELRQQNEELLESHVIDGVLRPLAQAIATK